MRYHKNQIEPAMVCLEVDFSKFFRTNVINLPDNYDFGMFTSQNEMLFPILNIKGEFYDKIINHFNNSKEEKQRLHNIKQYKLLTFFHLFYLICHCVLKKKAYK